MRISPVWLSLISLCCVAAGCRRYVDVPVRVIDAETNAPIAGAVVRSEYTVAGLTFADFLPFGTRLRELRRSTATSDSDGNAVVQLTPDGDTMVQGVSAKASGYLPSIVVPVAKDVLRGLRRSAAEGAEPVATIPMLVEPMPRVVLVLPDGYRGLVRVVSRYSESPPVPGQRIFLRPVAPERAALIEVPMMPLSYDYRSPISFHARYASGAEVPTGGRALDTDVALRVGEWRSDQYVLVVGTRADRELVHAYCNPDGLPSEARWRTIWSTGMMSAAETR